MAIVTEMTLWQYLHGVDQDVTLAINSLYSPVSDFIWQVFSDREIWFLLYAVVLFFFFRRLGWKKAAVVTLTTVLAIVICDQFANFTKVTVGRLRPCWDSRMVDGGLHMLEGAGNYFGFYSAHAANALAFALCSVFAFRHDSGHTYNIYSTAIILWALMVGISRIFVGKHYFGDVMVGFAVGFAVAELMNLLSSAIIAKFIGCGHSE